MRAFTCSLAARTGLIPTRDEVVFVDIGSKAKQMCDPPDTRDQNSCGGIEVQGLFLGVELSLASIDRMRMGTSPTRHGERTWAVPGGG